MRELLKIVRYSWSLKRYYLVITVFVVVGSLLYQATPFALGFIVDDLVGGISNHHVDSANLWLWLLVILGVNLTAAVINNWQGFYGDMLAAKLNTLLSQSYYDQLLVLPLEYFDKEVAGRITSRLDRSINTVTGFIQGMANNFIGNFLIAIITVLFLAVYAWPVAIALAVLFPVYAFLTRKSSARWQAKQMGINSDTDINMGRFVESVNQIRVVKSFAREVSESLFFTGKRTSIESQTRAQSMQWHMYDVYRRAALAGVFFFIYAYVVIETYHGKYSLGQMTMMLQLVNQAQFPLWGLSYVVDQLQRASAGSRDFFAVMETEPSITDKPEATELVVDRGRIEFQDVRFAYSGGEQVLDDLSFVVEPGTRVALVGESGEGKTTISNLLLRFYSISDGAISIDGVNIGDVTQASLRNQIGVVFQEPALFSGTIRENIAYGRPDATDEEVANAARIANAAHFIEHFREGYQTEIGERGVRLSGGQKQRIAIARAVLKDPPILIFDEATSSLDSRAEAEVQQALDRLMEGRSTLVIAHRLSTIAGVDKIVGISGGRVVEQGAPAELAQSGGMYSDLLSLQDPTTDNLAILRRYELASPDEDDEEEGERVS